MLTMVIKSKLKDVECEVLVCIQLSEDKGQRRAFKIIKYLWIHERR